uniref:Cysteine-rich protein 1 n=1 Tax=Caenorhabditis tropicalis TaxID=1561998 RepID=A0A1I7TZQ7_9PELO
MGKCPLCEKEVYFAEKITALGSDWHKVCFRCSDPTCKVILAAGKQAVGAGKPYCDKCYSVLYGPKGYHRGGTESHHFITSEYKYITFKFKT